jgi:hypothetical protein
MALTRVQTRRDAEAEAWSTYRDECARVPEHEYDEREPYAWRRLKKRLREIEEYEEFECR